MYIAPVLRNTGRALVSQPPLDTSLAPPATFHAWLLGYPPPEGHETWLRFFESIKGDQEATVRFFNADHLPPLTLEQLQKMIHGEDLV